MTTLETFDQCLEQVKQLKKEHAQMRAFLKALNIKQNELKDSYFGPDKLWDWVEESWPKAAKGINNYGD